MPQMSPMWWMMLMIMFVISLMMTMSKMYFLFNKKLTKKVKHLNMNYNWTW